MNDVRTGTVVCCPKHVEQLSDKINSVTCAYSWNFILEYYYDARTHER
jgi:hypothetical protein